MVLKRIQTVFPWSTALLALLLLTACQWVTDDYPDEDTFRNNALNYINLTITVSNGEERNATRAVPVGGENGDGREAGFERENAITGITFILADGALTDNGAKIAFIKYFPVTRVSVSAAGANLSSPTHNHSDANGTEVQYTTGNQLVKELDMTVNKNYHVYVLANCNVSAAKDDPLATVLKDKTLSSLWNCSGYQPDTYTNFAMTTEHDVQLNFTNTSDVTVEESPNAIRYIVNSPILIERLGARIDFCTNYDNNTKTAAYGTYTVSVGGTSTTVSGFKYIIDTNGNYFVLESITPFNLYNEGEYLFERVTNGWTGTPTTTYLGQETTANYVVDPRTSEKESTSLNYINQLGESEPTWSNLPYHRTAESLNSQTSNSKLQLNSNLTGDDKSNVFVVAYAMENTLLPTSPLKSYATGLAITGSYYTYENVYIDRKTFCGYLRHQGESSTSYRAYEWSGLDPSATVGSTPMNFSIVRNNIYRVSIESISPLALSLKLAVHDWRNVEHPTIYL